MAHSGLCCKNRPCVICACAMRSAAAYCRFADCSGTPVRARTRYAYAIIAMAVKLLTLRVIYNTEGLPYLLLKLPIYHDC